MINPPPNAPVEPISDEARAKSRAETMAARPAGDPVRVFAYGSLLWDPCFEVTIKRPARLPGWVRRTCLWTVHARGSLDSPGLFYGLDAEPDRACDGAVYELSSESLDEGLERLWRREMHAAIYTPRWLEVQMDGATTRALTFVVNRDHPQYAGPIDIKTAVRYITVARGKFGTCAEYYTATRASLRAEGFEDPEIEALVALVEVSPAGSF